MHMLFLSFKQKSGVFQGRFVKYAMKYICEILHKTDFLRKGGFCFLNIKDAAASEKFGCRRLT